MPTLIHRSICSLLEKSLNWATVNNRSDFHLDMIHGKTIQINILPMKESLYIHMNSTITVTNTHNEEANVSLESSLATLLKIQKGTNLTELIKSDELKIDGDLNVLQHFSYWLNELDVDVFEPLSKIIGDPMTHQVQRTGSKVTKNIQTLFKTKQRQYSDYLKYESNMLVERERFASFKEDIQKIQRELQILSEQMSHVKERQSCRSEN